MTAAEPAKYTVHEIDRIVSPVNVTLRCTCGWSRQITRRQNALARAAKIKAAISEHQRENP